MTDFLEKSFILPTEIDYKGALNAVNRLVETYILNPRDIRFGNLSQKYPSRSLSRKILYIKLGPTCIYN
jgi:hypothetical protein